MLAMLLSEFGGYLMAALAALVALVGVYLKGRSSGKADEVAKRETKINEQASEAREKVQHVEDEIARSDDVAVLERARKWVRK